MPSFQHQVGTVDGLLKNTSIRLLKARYCASIWILQRVEAGRHGRIRLLWRQKSQDQPHYITSHRSFRKSGQLLPKLAHRLAHACVIHSGRYSVQQDQTGEWLAYSDPDPCRSCQRYAHRIIFDMEVTCPVLRLTSGRPLYSS